MQLNDKDAYEQVAELDGVKIVDSSFVKSYLAKGWRELDFRERCRSLGREKKLYEVMGNYSSFDITYPDEMKREFSAFGTNLNILYDLLREGKEKARGKFKCELEELHNRFKIVLDIRQDLQENILRTKENSTEAYVEKNRFRSYLPVSIMIGSQEGIKKPVKERLFCQKEHDLHDERIFAKSMVIARNQPVYILTGDSDFIRIHNSFYNDIDILSEICKFAIHKYAVNIVARFKDSPLLITGPNERLRPLQEKRVYSFSCG